MPMTGRIFPNSGALGRTRCQRQIVALPVERLATQPGFQRQGSGCVFDQNDGLAEQNLFGGEDQLQLSKPIVQQALEIGSPQVGIPNLSGQNLQRIGQTLAKCYRRRFEKAVKLIRCQLGVHLERLNWPLPLGKRRMAGQATTEIELALPASGWVNFPPQEVA